MYGLQRKAVVSLLSSYISQFVTMVVNLATKLVLARLIAPDDLGVYAVALFFLLAGDMLVDAGMSQHIAREKDRPYGNMLLIRLFLSIVLFATVQGIADKLTLWGPEFPNVIRLMAITLIVKAYSGVANLFLDRELLIHRSVIPQLVRIGTMGLVSLLLAYLGYGVWALAWGTVASEVMFGLLISSAVRRRMPLTLTWQHTSRLIWGSKFLFLMAIMGFALQQGDTAIMGSLLSTEQVGYYTMAFTLIMLISRVVESAVFRVIYPLFCEYADNLPKLGKLYRTATLAIYCIEVPIYAYLLFNSPVVVSVLLGEKWLPAAGLMQALAIFGMINPFTTFGNEVLRARKLDSVLTTSTVLGAVVLMTSGYLLTDWLGAIGMVVAHYLIIGSLPVIITVRKLVSEEFAELSSQLFVVYTTALMLMFIVSIALAANIYLQAIIAGLSIPLCWYTYYRIFGNGIGRVAWNILLSRPSAPVSETS